MNDTFEPLFGVIEQAKRHEQDIKKLIAVGASIQRDGAYPVKSDHGYYASGNSGETNLTCDLTRHTAGRTGRTLLVHKSGWPETLYDEMRLMLGISDKLANAQMPNSAYHRIRETAWYLEQRAWSQYALKNHRRINHWLMLTPTDLNMVAALIIRLGEIYQNDAWFGSDKQKIDLADLKSGLALPTSEKKREITRNATQANQSLIQFVHGFLSNDIEIKTEKGHYLEVSGYETRGRLVLNVSGKISENLHFQQTGDHIILGRQMPASAVAGMIGKPVREIIDLPWIDENEKVVDAYVDGRLHIHLRDRNDKSADGVIIGQVLPKKARPGNALGWEK